MRIAHAIGIPNRQSPVTGDLFTPPAVSGLAIWLRADKGITIATGVSNWLDARGSGNAVAQGTVGLQPLVTAVNAAFNNQPTVNFDGVDDFLQGAFALVQPSHVFIACKFNTVLSQAVFDGATDVGMLLRQELGGTTLTFFGGAALTITIASTTAKHVYDLQFNGASSASFVDAVANIAGNAGASAANGLTVGARGAGTTPANVSVAEIAVYSRILSAAEDSRVTSYMRARYAI